MWVGGGSPRTAAVARDEGAALNLWGASLDEVARQAATGEVTWGGPTPRAADDSVDPVATSDLVADLAAAGATWAVFSWPAPLEALGAGSGANGRRR